MHGYCSFASYYFINFPIWLIFFSFSFSLSLLPLKRTQLLFFSLIFFFLCYRATHPQGQSNIETHKHTHTDKPIDSLWIGGAGGDAVYGSTELDRWWRLAFLGQLDRCLWKRSLLVEEIGYCDKEGNLSVRA